MTDDKEEGDWRIDVVDQHRVAREGRQLVETVAFSKEGQAEQVYQGLAHILAGFSLLKGQGVYRGVARKHVDQYFDYVFGRLD